MQIMSEGKEILKDMQEDAGLKALWDNYCENDSYAAETRYEDIMGIILQITETLGIPHI